MKEFIFTNSKINKDKNYVITNKLKIGLIFETKDEVKAFVKLNCPAATVSLETANTLVYNTLGFYFDWLKPNSHFKGKRYNFVFTTEEIRNTEWFDTVIRPCLMAGTSAIDM